MNLMNVMLDTVREIHGQVRRGPKSALDKMVQKAEDDGNLDLVIEKAFKVLSTSDLETTSLNTLTYRLAQSVSSSTGIPLPGKKGKVSTGINIANWFAQGGLVKPVKEKQIVQDKSGEYSIEDKWFLKPLSDFREYQEDTIFCDPRRSYDPWMKATRHCDGRQIPIVKRADQYGLLAHYAIEEIPMIYKVLNKLQGLQWEINLDMLEYAGSIEEHNSPLPKLPDPQDFGRAQSALRNVKTSSKKRISSRKIIGSHEKRKAFDSILEKAIEYQGHDLTFVYNVDGRGRIYALAPLLNPQSQDIAKAILVTKEKHPMVKREFYIHTANCAGVDKETYDDRVKWVDEHYDTLVAIGRDPIAAWPLIQELGVHKEKKTYYQFIACCIDLYKWAIDPDHKTGILLGLDSTSSGNQILAMLARDHEVAEYVNISPTPNGKPGDLYAYVGKFVRKGLRSVELEHLTERLQSGVNMNAIKALGELPEGHKTYRKITKRICMVLPYSGTKYGAGDIMRADQGDHGSDLVEALNYSDCTAVGNIIHDQCKEAARKSMDMMKYMVDGVSELDEVLPMLTWRIPHTNFLAFQEKELTREDGIAGIIGDVKVTLKVEVPKLKDGKNVGNIDKHKNAISPAIVHSLDAAMLTLIINNLPDDVPMSAIHDQFCVPFGNMPELINVAREAYLSISDRDQFELLYQSAFGKATTLPKAGSWNPSDLYKTDYFIC